MKSCLVFLPHISKHLGHKGLGFSVYRDRKENTQAKGQKIIKYKGGEVYLVYHCLALIRSAEKRGRKEYAFLPLV